MAGEVRRQLKVCCVHLPAAAFFGAVLPPDGAEMFVWSERLPSAPSFFCGFFQHLTKTEKLHFVHSNRLKGT